MNASLFKHIYPILSPNLKGIFGKVSQTLLAQMTEVRLRIQKPLLLVIGKDDIMVNTNGRIVGDLSEAYICSSEDICQTFQLISRNSVYALEQELKMGFITINGGHRIGLAGQAIVHSGELKALKNISSLTIRVAREVQGSADIIVPYVIESNNRVLSTLIISPPRCGKTTVLRDLIRQIGGGCSRFKFHGVQVGVVDERSEIAACQNGIPTVDLGPRVDVLDGCPKATGMIMLIRSMSPQVIMTDELGRNDDAQAVREALNAGVSVITTVHGRSVEEIARRPHIGELIEHKYFERYVILSDKPTIGTVEKIISVQQGEVLYSAAKGVSACG